MDFHFSEEQTMLRELAREILEKEVTPERLKEVEAEGDWFDRELWAKLAEANLLGLAVPEAQGGMGMGFLELCVLLQEVGRAVAPLPALPTLVLRRARHRPLRQRRAAAALARAARERRGRADGRLRAPAKSRRRSAPARAGGSTGAFRNVPAVHLAGASCCRPRTPEGEAVFLVDPEAEGVSLVRADDLPQSRSSR